MYEPYQDEAEAALKEQIKQVLAAKSKDLVIDYSFWSKENRDEYRELVNAKGGGDYQGKVSSLKTFVRGRVLTLSLTLDLLFTELTYF
jgi:hypothetical protein